MTITKETHGIAIMRQEIEEPTYKEWGRMVPVELVEIDDDNLSLFLLLKIHIYIKCKIFFNKQQNVGKTLVNDFTGDKRNNKNNLKHFLSE
jgi:hypothetical protein